MKQLFRSILVFAFAFVISGCGGRAASPVAPSSPTIVPAPPVASASILTVDGFRTLSAKAETGHLTAMVTYSDGTVEDQSEAAVWSSSNPSVATVDNTGIVTALRDGHTTVTATFGAATGARNIIVDLS